MLGNSLGVYVLPKFYPILAIYIKQQDSRDKVRKVVGYGRFEIEEE